MAAQQDQAQDPEAALRAAAPPGDDAAASRARAAIAAQLFGDAPAPLADDALRGAAPAADDDAAARARAAIASQLFGDAPAPASTRALGRYRIEAQIGAGGMGVVYRAHDPELDRRVAVKILHAGAAEGSRGRQRMIREARAMARVAHPNVIHVYDVGAVDDEVFVAMELVDGVSLARWLGAAARPFAAILERFLAAGEGLAAAHRAGLVHRDFKPENVLCGADGRVRVLDFGLARAAEGGSRGGESSGEGSGSTSEGEVASPTDGALIGLGDLGASLTRTGAILGTPRYMAPEQCLGRPTDARSDQFSFCVALYEAAYKVPPFGGRSVHEYLDEVVAGAVRAPPAGSGAPEWLWPVLQRGLSREPGDRFPAMAELLAALAGPAAVSAGAPRPERSRGGWLGWLAVGGAAAGLALWLAVRGGQVDAVREDGVAVEGAVQVAAASAGASPIDRAPVGDATLGAVGAAPAGESTTSGSGEAAGGSGAPREGGEGGEGGEASPEAAVGQAPVAGAARTRRQDWCYLDEDRYTLLQRMPRRRTHIVSDGRCFACRPETRASRVARFQPTDCGHFQLCGPTRTEECS